MYFLKGNYSKVSFGWLLTFLSGFGQTFLISLYVPEIIRSFEISEDTFGAIYAACTIAASVIMLTVGHTVDHKPVKKVTAFTVIGLALSSIILGLSHHIAFLFMALIGLRLTGQGLLTHISMTVISKQFVRDRGKALSIILPWIFGWGGCLPCYHSFTNWMVRLEDSRHCQWNSFAFLFDPAEIFRSGSF